MAGFRHFCNNRKNSPLELTCDDLFSSSSLGNVGNGLHKWRPVCGGGWGSVMILGTYLLLGEKGWGV